VREEKGLAYFVRAARVIGLRTGMFYFFAGTSPERHAEVLAEFDAEIARVQAGAVEDEELRRCQTRLKAARRLGLQTNSARAMQAGLHALFDLPSTTGRTTTPASTPSPRRICNGGPGVNSSGTSARSWSCAVTAGNGDGATPPGGILPASCPAPEPGAALRHMSTNS